MAIHTTNVVAPVFATTEVVVFLSAGMAAQTCFGNLFRGFVFERNDLAGIAFFSVSLAWSMARLATSHFVFPATDPCELRMRRMRESLKLIFVTVFTRLTADVVSRLVYRRRLRGVTVTQPAEHS